MLTTRDERLTPSEAAVVAGVTVREIHRVIDEHILPERFYAMEGGRRLDLAACPLVAFYFHAAKALTADERSLLIGRLADRIGTRAAGNAVKMPNAAMADRPRAACRRCDMIILSW